MTYLQHRLKADRPGLLAEAKRAEIRERLVAMQGKAAEILAAMGVENSRQSHVKNFSRSSNILLDTPTNPT